MLHDGAAGPQYVAGVSCAPRRASRAVSAEAQAQMRRTCAVRGRREKLGLVRDPAGGGGVGVAEASEADEAGTTPRREVVGTCPAYGAGSLGL